MDLTHFIVWNLCKTPMNTLKTLTGTGWLRHLPYLPLRRQALGEHTRQQHGLTWRPVWNDMTVRDGHGREGRLIYTRGSSQLRISVRNSSLVLGSSRKTPSMVLVTVLLFIFCTPRITMHMWLSESNREEREGEREIQHKYELSGRNSTHFLYNTLTSKLQIQTGDEFKEKRHKAWEWSVKPGE